MEWCLRVIHFRRRKQLFEMDKNICKSQGGLSPRGIISSRKTTLSFLQDAPMLSSGEVAKQTKSRRNLVIHYFSKDASLSIWIKYKMSRKFHRECIKIPNCFLSPEISLSLTDLSFYRNPGNDVYFQIYRFF